MKAASVWKTKFTVYFSHDRVEVDVSFDTYKNQLDEVRTVCHGTFRVYSHSLREMFSIKNFSGVAILHPHKKDLEYNVHVGIMQSFDKALQSIIDHKKIDVTRNVRSKLWKEFKTQMHANVIITKDGNSYYTVPRGVDNSVKINTLRKDYVS